MVVRNTLHLVELAEDAEPPGRGHREYPGVGKTLPVDPGRLLPCLPADRRRFVQLLRRGKLQRGGKRLAGKDSSSRAWKPTSACSRPSLGLIKEGFDVHLAMDAVCSRTKANWRSGLELIRHAGGSDQHRDVLFQLLGVAARRSSRRSRTGSNRERETWYVNVRSEKKDANF